eukprot:s33_g21.t1
MEDRAAPLSPRVPDVLFQGYQVTGMVRNDRLTQQKHHHFRSMGKTKQGATSLELSRRHQRNATTADELRSELKALSATKLARPEAEALVAGALADWVRAAQAGADAVQNAVAKGRALCEVSGRSFEGLDVSFGTSLNDSWIQTAEDVRRACLREGSPTP